MPCMGPSKTEAFARGEEAYNEVAALLKAKYYVILPGEMHSSVFDVPLYHAKLKTAIQELFWEDACDGF